MERDPYYTLKPTRNYVHSVLLEISKPEVVPLYISSRVAGRKAEKRAAKGKKSLGCNTPRSQLMYYANGYRAVAVTSLLKVHKTSVIKIEQEAFPTPRRCNTLDFHSGLELAFGEPISFTSGTEGTQKKLLAPVHANPRETGRQPKL